MSCAGGARASLAVLSAERRLPDDSRAVGRPPVEVCLVVAVVRPAVLQRDATNEPDRQSPIIRESAFSLPRVSAPPPAPALALSPPLYPATYPWNPPPPRQYSQSRQ